MQNEFYLLGIRPVQGPTLAFQGYSFDSFWKTYYELYVLNKYRSKHTVNIVLGSTSGRSTGYCSWIAFNQEFKKGVNVF